MDDGIRAVFDGTQLLLVEEELGRFAVVADYGNGKEKLLPAVTPAEALIAAAEIDYQDYRREIKRLREEHPLFEDRVDISVADFEDFVAETLLLPSMIQESDPVSFFVLENFCTRVCSRRMTVAHHSWCMQERSCFIFWRTPSVCRFVCRTFLRWPLTEWSGRRRKIGLRN